ICNSKDVVLRNVDSTLLTVKAIDGLASGVILAISRGQIEFWLMDITGSLKKGNTQSVDWKERLKISNLRPSETEGKARTLTYDVKSGDETIHFKVWYDPETYKPIKRSYESRSDRLSAQGVEVYENLTLNAELPDSK